MPFSFYTVVNLFYIFNNWRQALCVCMCVCDRDLCVHVSCAKFFMLLFI